MTLDGIALAGGGPVVSPAVGDHLLSVSAIPARLVTLRPQIQLFQLSVFQFAWLNFGIFDCRIDSDSSGVAEGRGGWVGGGAAAPGHLGSSSPLFMLVHSSREHVTPEMNKLRQSLRRKKPTYVPEASRPHQWQADEEAVRKGKCNFAVRVSVQRPISSYDASSVLMKSQLLFFHEKKKVKTSILLSFLPSFRYQCVCVCVIGNREWLAWQ